MPKFSVPSLSVVSTTYDVDPDAPSCTCPAFKHSRQKRWCKHLTFVTQRPDMYASSDDDGPTEKLLSEEVPGVYTLGHSNHSIEDFLYLLERHHIRAMIDVRSSPYSRFSPHFKRETLRESVREAGIDYFWAGKDLGGLGNVPITSVAFIGRINQVVGMASHTRIALMCSEGKPADCHRFYKLGVWLHRNASLIARHIERDGTLTPHDELEKKMGPDGLWTGFGGKMQ